ncbi:cytochrome c oxidase assembly protein [Virgibacillus kimchii]
MHHAINITPFWNAFFISVSVIAVGGYVTAVIFSNKKDHLSNWPWFRTMLWTAGIMSALIVMIGPLAEAVHKNFTLHMFGHLLLGMLSPLLLVLSSPIRLLLRALPVSGARKLTKLMRSRYIQFITHPVTASILNIGGLWLLYTTSLFDLMHTYTWLYLLVHFHVFLAGYVFTAAMIYIDPIPHRYSYLYRSVVFILALAGHQILSKYIYAYPPEGVAREQAEAGGMLMYYGGNIIDVVIIYIICLHWYRSKAPKTIMKASG